VDYIHACTIKAWTIETWPKDNPEEIQAHPFRCGSWRHEGDCRLFKGAQDFARIKVALNSHAPWMHCVLTYPTGDYKDVKALFRLGLSQWSALRKRLKRRFGEFFYIQTWETTRRGYPHCHMALANLRLWRECGSDAINNFHRLLRDHAVAVGFGRIGWVDAIRNMDAMAGYLTKLARELTGKGKEYQVPVNAPRHFRRLRASVRLLPPVNKNPDISGVLRFCDLHGEILSQTAKCT